MPVLGTQNDIVTHRQALPHKDVATAIETVRDSRSAQPSVRLAFEFLVLTAARSAEARLATWEEIDPQARVWTVPASRTKAGREHRVPLGSRVVEIVDEARRLGVERTAGAAARLVFSEPARQDTIGNAKLSGVLQQLGIGAVPHCFRSSFRDWGRNGPTTRGR